MNVTTRAPAVYLLFSIFCVGLSGYSASAAAKPAWKNTVDSTDTEYRSRGRGRKKHRQQSEPAPEASAEAPVVEEAVLVAPDDTEIEQDFKGIPVISEPEPEPVIEEIPVVEEEPLPEPIVNQAPVIAGQSDAWVTENSFYEFVPVASDAEGDLLTFAISNQPSWTDFDPTTGALYGTPEAIDAGSYHNIEISVMDSQHQVFLPAFSVEVQPAAVMSMALSWQPPLENTDDSPLTDLAGYRIYSLDADGQYVLLEELSNPGLTSYVLEGLEPGLWSVAMTAVNGAGFESDFSGLKQIDLRN